MIPSGIAAVAEESTAFSKAIAQQNFVDEEVIFVIVPN